MIQWTYFRLFIVLFFLIFLLCADNSPSYTSKDDDNKDNYQSSFVMSLKEIQDAFLERSIHIQFLFNIICEKYGCCEFPHGYNKVCIINNSKILFLPPSETEMKDSLNNNNNFDKTKLNSSSFDNKTNNLTIINKDYENLNKMKLPIIEAFKNTSSLKDKFNYASADCAASVRATNPGARNAFSVLLHSPDLYMITPCSTKDRFLVIELCQEILVDTLVLSNLELFSSTFKIVRVSYSKIYPPPQSLWTPIAELNALNSRSFQAFYMPSPLRWTRYLKLDFISHHGNNFYCPLSIFKVYGTSMLEEYHKDEEKEEKEENLNNYDKKLTFPIISEVKKISSSQQSNNNRLKMINYLPNNKNINFNNNNDDSLEEKETYKKLPTQTNKDEKNNNKNNLWGFYNLPNKTSIYFFPSFSELLEQYGQPIKGTSSSSTSKKIILPKNNQNSSLDDKKNYQNNTVNQCSNEKNNCTKVDEKQVNTNQNDSIIEENDNKSKNDGNEAKESEEGVYKSFLKRFAAVELNYKLLASLMDEFSKRIRFTFEAHECYQSKKIEQSFDELSKLLASRLNTIRQDLHASLEASRSQDQRRLKFSRLEIIQLTNLANKLQEQTKLLQNIVLLLIFSLISSCLCFRIFYFNKNNNLSLSSSKIIQNNNEEKSLLSKSPSYSRINKTKNILQDNTLTKERFKIIYSTPQVQPSGNYNGSKNTDRRTYTVRRVQSDPCVASGLRIKRRRKLYTLASSTQQRRKISQIGQERPSDPMKQFY